jgi:ATP-binding cassette, subfamily B, bacterial
MNSITLLKDKLRSFLMVRLALHHVWQSGPALMVGSSLLLLVQGLLPLLTLYLMKLVVDAVTAGVASPDKVAAFKKVVWVISLAAGVGLFNAVLSSVAAIVRELQQVAFQDHMQDIILRRSVELDLEYYENANYYDSLHRAQQGGAYRPVAIVNRLVEIAQNAISLVAIATLLVSLHWSVGLILLAATVPGVFVRINYSERLHAWLRKSSTAERLASYFHFLVTTAPAAKEVRIFGLGPFFIRCHRKLRAQLRHEKIRMTAALSIKELITQGVGTIGLFGVFAWLSLRAMQGHMSLGDIVMYYQGIQRGIGFLRSILGSLTSLYEDCLFLSYLADFLKLDNKVADPLNPTPMARPIREGIVFDRVGFHYAGDDHMVLEDVSLTIKAGETVAIVGENGAGKTTLIKLLCRLYDPTHGTISIDGTDVREFAIDELRREISPIFQDYLQLSLSAGDNIRLGDVDAAIDPGRIAQAARLTGAEDFIQRLPHGYETQLGRMFEGGAELSIGQWQRLALARALFRNGQIIVLDEPTSSQDARSEYEFFQNFRHLARGRIAVIISHRFSTVRMADRIFVLQDGSIIENGSHDELMDLHGAYAGLFNLQAKGWQ